MSTTSAEVPLPAGLLVVSRREAPSLEAASSRRPGGVTRQGGACRGQTDRNRVWRTPLTARFGQATPKPARVNLGSNSSAAQGNLLPARTGINGLAHDGRQNRRNPEPSEDPTALGPAPGSTGGGRRASPHP